MMMMMLMMHQGAEVVIWNPDGSRRSKSVLSSRDGEYWRVLVPGPPGNNTYTVQVICNIYFRRFQRNFAVMCVVFFSHSLNIVFCGISLTSLTGQV